ncbi:MAG: hypothetical protein VB024_11305 [Dysgonamonadaceae bacterium]|jgi:hypothetical protein|nr:hypothetical protein [Dysgonamonadaceae bacterium]
MMSCSTKNNIISNKNITNEEIVVLHQPEGSIVWPIKGTIYNAIEPRYISDVNGFTISERTDNDQVVIEKTFELMTSDYSFLSSSSGSKLWNLYINDKLMPYYSRILASVLKPQAIEEVKYIKNDSLKIVFVSSSKISDINEQGVEAVKIYTRDLTLNDNSNYSTIYFLGDTNITSKIFEAINPVFIKSLHRITDKNDLITYKQKGLKEVVKIELFSLSEVLSLIIADGGNSVLLIDNIKLPLGTETKMKHDLFKKIKHVSVGDEEFSSFEQNYQGKKGVYNYHIIN